MSDGRFTRVTTVQYLIEDLLNWTAYTEKVHGLIAAAKREEAELVVFSEYSGIELMFKTQGTLLEQFNAIQAHLEAYLTFYQNLAQEFKMYIQPGTIPVGEDTFVFKNRAFFFSPNKKVEFQDKMLLIPAERDIGFIKPGTQLKIFETSFAKIGIAVCYDSEFPFLVHKLVKAGAHLIIVPSCTETIEGNNRVSVSSRARAIENQCYVVQSSLIGNFFTSEFIERNIGQSGIYSPIDEGFPKEGILAQAHLNQFGLVTADLHWDKLEVVRNHGQVTNYLDTLRSQDTHTWEVKSVDF